MCFSATASFGAGAALGVIGIASLTRIKRKSDIAFASVPLLFAIQQVTEGLNWLSLTPPVNLQLNWYATTVFLIFAQVFWCVWIPVSMLFLPGKQRRLKIQWLFVAMGAAEALYQAYLLLNYPFHSEIAGHHILYDIKHPSALNYVEPLFYIGAILAPPFFCRVKGMLFLAVANLASCLVTFIFYTRYTFSIWCFFAAIISISVFYILKRNNETREPA